MALRDRQMEFGGYFISAGYPLVSAAAIVGNATQENLCEPTTKGTKDHGSDGLLQWRLGRLERLMKLPEWDTLKVQAMFTIRELQAAPSSEYFDMDYRVLESDLRLGAKPLATLTANFVDAYERPSEDGRMLDARIRYATDAYNFLRSVHGSAKTQIDDHLYIPKLPSTTGDSTMDPALIATLVKVFAPIAEAMLSGLVKGIIQHAESSQGGKSMDLSKIGDLSKIPSLNFNPADLSSLAKLIIAEIEQQKKA